MKQNHNSRRINAQAREKLAQILLFEISDPALMLVTLTGVEVSVDKSVLRAYISCESERYDEVSAALARARGRVRSLLGRALGWRVTPEIIWQIDTTVDEAERIERALQDVPPTMEIEKNDEGYPVDHSAEEA
ncbi:30S ribosome-binding factor RbfA [Olegusella massiliensis]|uniref:30S ribosome-binding factor RbfA n=1 Tax=Olegusella massiliensis TaxID=1776381 RepID=UPI0003AE0833|nr:30S ribosome-binding factor RbfA [Olegusella massiliensis]ERL12729.1 ribosome-binding factor A [Coriobacteriaceae bacterium BV3Ac1]MBS5865325.1 30S ribosome-binding factor RbfA [Coriobacteriaceae bacterium]